MGAGSHTEWISWIRCSSDPPGLRSHAWRELHRATGAPPRDRADRRGTGSRSLVETVEDRREQAERIGRNIDSIELSDAARSVVDDASAQREERIEELRAAANDGSLFDRDRLARAAERLLAE